MTQVLKQSTAVDVLIGPFVDSTDGYTGESGVSPAVKLSKNGQALAAKSDATTPVHDADGYYNCELDATDTNTVGTLVLSVVGSATSLPVRHEFQVVEEAIYDALFGASATGLLPANMTQVSGDSTAADNLEAMLDGTGGVTLTSAISGNITGNLSGSVGSVTGAVGSVTGNVGGNVAGSVASVTGGVGGNVSGSVGSLATQAKADVNAEVADVVNTDTYAEPGQGAPSATPTLSEMLQYLYFWKRNKGDFNKTTGVQNYYADDGSTVAQKATHTDDGTTTTKGEIGTGA